MPTILALAGVGTPPSMDGRSFAHLLNPDHRLSGDGQVLLFFGAGAAGAGSTAGTAGAAGSGAGWVSNQQHQQHQQFCWLLNC